MLAFGAPDAAAIAVTVEVDPDTGGVTIERILVVEDCGTVINPLIAEGRIRSGVGLALLERFIYDEAGQRGRPSLADYLLPRAIDLPRIEIEHLETPSQNTPAGVKGRAEGVAAATPAAVICAVLDAIAPHGGAIEELPLRPETIAQAVPARSRRHRGSASFSHPTADCPGRQSPDGRGSPQHAQANFRPCRVQLREGAL